MTTQKKAIEYLKIKGVETITGRDGELKIRYPNTELTFEISHDEIEYRAYCYDAHIKIYPLK